MKLYQRQKRKSKITLLTPIAHLREVQTSSSLKHEDLQVIPIFKIYDAPPKQAWIRIFEITLQFQY